MANVIEADTALWLRNKLDNEDQWSSGGLTSLLTTDVLRNTYRCFRSLDHRVRLKLLLSFLEIRRRNLETLRDELSMVVNLGIDDEDDWVRLVACILSDYPHSAALHPDIREGSETFSQLVSELSDQVNESSIQWNALPCECPYLNKTALISSFGSQPPPSKSFTLRRKPKSAALRAHLTQKASEASSHRRSSVNQPHSTPLSPIKKNAGLPKDVQKHYNAPAKPQPIVPLRQHTRPTMRESVLPKKTKLLDITEQPMGGTSREAKKRRKQAEADNSGETEAKQKKTSEHSRQSKQQKQAEAKANNDVVDYAAGLNGPKEQVQPKEERKKEPEEEAKPSYAVIPSGANKPSYAPPVSSVPTPQPPDIGSIISVDPKASMATQEIQRELQIRIRQQQALRQQQILKDAKLKATAVNDAANLPASAPGQQPPSHAAKDLKEAQRTAIELSQRLNKQAKPGLSLTKEQMLAAQEMFRSANKVTRAEKALILGFMAGARDNPFPQQGPVLTIKLSENTETSQSGGSNSQTTLIEMLFEMNYATGHWRRLKRTRVLAPMNEG